MGTTVHTVYQTTNILNDVFYVGKHSTEDIYDSYLGSGTYLKRAIKKYDRENFHKSILFIFDNEQEAFEKEFEIIQENINKGYETYNIATGGKGGIGTKRSEEAKEKCRIGSLGNKNALNHKCTDEAKQLMKYAHAKRSKEEKTIQAKKAVEYNTDKWLLINLEGEQFEVSGLEDFTKENNLSIKMLRTHSDGKLIKKHKSQKSNIAKNTVGWKCLRLTNKLKERKDI